MGTIGICLGGHSGRTFCRRSLMRTFIKTSWLDGQHYWRRIIDVASHSIATKLNADWSRRSTRRSRNVGPTNTLYRNSPLTRRCTFDDHWFGIARSTVPRIFIASFCISQSTAVCGDTARFADSDIVTPTTQPRTKSKPTVDQGSSQSRFFQRMASRLARPLAVSCESPDTHCFFGHRRWLLSGSDVQRNDSRHRW